MGSSPDEADVLLSGHDPRQGQRAPRLRLRGHAHRAGRGDDDAGRRGERPGRSLRLAQPHPRLRPRACSPRGGEAMSAVAVDRDLHLARSLRAGDEQAFAELVARYHASLLRVAMIYVRNRSVAEEVVQETWLGVIEGLERFESRSLLKTWIFRILTNRAKTRAARERRTIPFSALASEDDEGGPSVEPERFLSDDTRWAGHWASPPRSWSATPEDRLVSRETLPLIP